MRTRAGIIGGVIGGIIKLALDQLTFAVGISSVDTVGQLSRLLFGSTKISLVMWIVYLIATGLAGWLVSWLIPAGSINSYFVSGIVVGAVLWTAMNLIFTAIGTVTPTWAMGAGSFIVNLITHIVLGISITYTMLRYKAGTETTA